MALQRKETRRTVNLKSLKPHPLSVQIYGLEPGDELLDGISRNGILQDIVVAADQVTVVSGNRRRAAAIDKGIKQASITVRGDLIHEDDIELAVLDYNQTAPRTREMKARESAHRKRLKLKAAGDGGKQKDVIADVASDMGVSQTTARRAISAIEAAEELTNQGKKKEAAEVVKTMNEEGFAAAKKLADKHLPPREYTKPKKKRSPAAPKAKTTKASAPSTAKKKKLNARDAKRMVAARKHLASLLNATPKAVYAEAGSYLKMLKEVFDRFE